jgi:hypothetical protein
MIFKILHQNISVLGLPSIVKSLLKFCRRLRVLDYCKVIFVALEAATARDIGIRAVGGFSSRPRMNWRNMSDCVRPVRHAQAWRIPALAAVRRKVSDVFPVTDAIWDNPICNATENC